jgi:TonB family protein
MRGCQAFLIGLRRGCARLIAACSAMVPLTLFIFCGPEPKPALVPSRPQVAPPDQASEPEASTPPPALASPFGGGDAGDSANPMASDSLDAGDSGGDSAIERLRHGGLGPEPIRRVVIAHAGALHACYELEARKDGSLRGGVTVTWKVEKSGAVTNAQVAGTTIHNVNVEDCVLRQVRSWKFPSNEGSSHVTFPFVFDVRR